MQYTQMQCWEMTTLDIAKSVDNVESVEGVGIFMNVNGVQTVHGARSVQSVINIQNAETAGKTGHVGHCWHCGLVLTMETVDTVATINFLDILCCAHTLDIVHAVDTTKYMYIYIYIYSCFSISYFLSYSSFVFPSLFCVACCSWGSVTPAGELLCCHSTSGLVKEIKKPPLLFS